MSNLNLWNELDKLKKTCKWIDLSHEVSAETPHWHGFSSLKSTALYELEKDGFTTHTYEIVGQYGTHVDAPIHFVKGERTLDTFTPEDMTMAICVIDKSKEEEKNELYRQIDLCDGFILQGGLYSSNYEIEMAKRIIELDKPLIGICAGFNNILRALGTNVIE